MPSQSPFPALDIPKTNLLSYLFPTGADDDDKPLWITSNNELSALSPNQLLSLVKRVAAGFVRLGIGRGDVVAVFTPNHIYVPVIYLATVGYGAVFTGFNPAYTVGELVHLMKDSKAKVIFVHPQLLGPASEAAQEAGLSESSLILFSDGKDGIQSPGIQDWRTYFGSSSEASCWKWDNYDSKEAEARIATINYSSG